MPSAIVNNKAKANPGLRVKLLAEYRKLRSALDNNHFHLQPEGRSRGLLGAHNFCFIVLNNSYVKRKKRTEEIDQKAKIFVSFSSLQGLSAG